MNTYPRPHIPNINFFKLPSDYILYIFVNKSDLSGLKMFIMGLILLLIIEINNILNLNISDSSVNFKQLFRFIFAIF